ncbi:MAG: AlkZ family DNA glycosylase [Phycisphaerae bacterium]|nr:AlkZ family DNA glycosylase [Gemmatimonadaceae bacterium]
MNSESIRRDRLHNLHLLGNVEACAEDVVQSLVAVQAQDYTGSKWGLGLRTQGSSDAAVEAACSSGRILRTHALRPTWHFVTPDDIRWLLGLTAPRVLAASKPLFRRMELDAPVLSRAMIAIERALQDGAITRDGLRSALEDAGINTRGDLRMSYILIFAELQALVCSGPRQGNQFTYALLDTRAAKARVLTAEEAVAELALRYFRTRGPATVQDFAKWSGLTLKACRTGLEASRGELHEQLGDGGSYWGPAITKTGTGGCSAYLVSIYDEYVSSYRDRSAICSPGLAPKLMAMGNALTGIVLLDGQVAGTWKRILRKDAVKLSVTMLVRLTKAARIAITANAHEYARFFGLAAQLDFTT